MPNNTNLAHLVSAPIANPRTQWVEITPDVAERWLGKNEGNRNQRPKHVAKLVRDLEGQRWLTTGDTIKFDWDGRLIDGQHRLSAIVASNIPMLTLVVWDLDPQVQGVLDAQAKRAAKDALFFHGVDNYKTVIAAMARISLSREAGHLQTSTDTTMRDVTNSEVVDWYIANDDADWAATLAVKTHKYIGASPSPLAYSILVISRIDKEACAEFFESTAESRTEGSGDPRLTLTRIFKDKEKVRVNNAAQLSYLLRAWNAWREGRKVSKLPLSVNYKAIAIPEPK